MMMVVVVMMMMLVEAMMTMTAFMMRMTLTQGSCGHLRQGDCPAGRSQCGTANGIRIGARPIRVRGHVGTLRINCIWLLWQWVTVRLGSCLAEWCSETFRVQMFVCVPLSRCHWECRIVLVLGSWIAEGDGQCEIAPSRGSAAALLWKVQEVIGRKVSMILGHNLQLQLSFHGKVSEVTFSWNQWPKQCRNLPGWSSRSSSAAGFAHVSEAGVSTSLGLMSATGCGKLDPASCFTHGDVCILFAGWLCTVVASAMWFGFSEMCR